MPRSIAGAAAVTFSRGLARVPSDRRQPLVVAVIGSDANVVLTDALNHPSGRATAIAVFLRRGTIAIRRGDSCGAPGVVAGSFADRDPALTSGEMERKL
jgi:hypothetical protein